MPDLTPQETMRRFIKRYKHDPERYILEVIGVPFMEPWQKEVCDYMKACCLDPALSRRIAVRSGHGIGKAQPHSTMTPTPYGWVEFGSLIVGDEVFSETGEPVKVKGIYEQGERPVYRVTFDDGSSVLADEEHLWNVRGRQERRKRVKGWRTVTTSQLLTAGVKRSNGTSEARQWEIPIQGAAQFNGVAPIDPYLMGVWLGDGCWSNPRITSGDPELFKLLERRGVSLGSARDITRTVLGGCLKPWLGSKRTHEKRVPTVFMTANISARLDVLRGLMDTDGTIDADGRVTFCSTSKGLVEDVIGISRSLGWKAQMQAAVKKPYYRGKGGQKVDGLPAYNCTILATECPFYLTKKVKRWKPIAQHRYSARWIDSIEYVGLMPCRCIQVDSEAHLYLTDHFIVTHNTAFMAWINKWFMATRLNPRGVVTANTENQLSTKTWPELSKWNSRSKDGSWFEWTATKFAMKSAKETWFASAIPWTKEKSEAFAGTHADSVLLEFDEASAIEDVIWEVAEGAMTTNDCWWLAFGNPTRNSGRFTECWGKFRHRWKTLEIDSRTVSIANQEQINAWITDYGEDSDFVRVRVRGVPPRSSMLEFIGRQDIDKGLAYKAQNYTGEPRIFGIDCARFGDDQNVVFMRQGRKTQIIKKWRGLDTMQSASHIVELSGIHNPEAIFIDGGGPGAGIVDRCRVLIGQKVIEVNFGGEPSDKGKYANKRAEMWGELRQALRAGLEIPDDQELIDDLLGPLYSFTGKEQILLEKKKDMKKRGLASPDAGDALALTFAHSVVKQREEEEDFEPSGSFWST